MEDGPVRDELEDLTVALVELGVRDGERVRIVFGMLALLLQLIQERLRQGDLDKFPLALDRIREARRTLHAITPELLEQGYHTPVADYEADPFKYLDEWREFLLAASQGGGWLTSATRPPGAGIH
jgi:hypothetical protein